MNRRYIVDGNSLFLSATEAAWRRATGPHYSGGGLIVAIGYPLTTEVYCPKRNYDLTPPSSKCPEGYGGAEEFLEFIQSVVRPFVREEVFPNITFSREALFGHSFGGLFSLYALYTRPLIFDLFIAGSPTMEWNDYCLSSYEDKFRSTPRDSDKEPSTLMLYYGSYEQDPRQWRDESPEDFERRKKACRSRNMTGNATALQKRLQECKLLHSVALKEYEGEDHGSAIACGLSRSLTTFFEEWPLAVDE